MRSLRWSQINGRYNHDFSNMLHTSQINLALKNLYIKLTVLLRFSASVHSLAAHLRAVDKGARRCSTANTLGVFLIGALFALILGLEGSSTPLYAQHPVHSQS